MKYFSYLLGGVAALGLAANFAAAQSLLAPAPVETTTLTAGLDDASAEADSSRRGGLVAGVGIYLVQPYFQHNLAYTVLVENQNPPRGTPTFHLFDSVDVSHHMDVAPLVWLGYVGESGLGGRARYWTFRQGTNQSLTFPASTGPSLTTVFSATPLGLEAFGDTLFQPDKDKPPIAVEPTAVAITTKLLLHVGDVEVMQDLRAGPWNFLFAGGVRIARIEQNYNFYNLQPLATPLVLRTLASSYNFTGAGPVLAGEARRSLGETGLAVFSNGRAALVFGNAQQNANFGGTVLRNDDSNPQWASENRNRAIPVVELELGLEYGRTVGQSWMFGQVALVGQDWVGAGNATRSAADSFREGAQIGGSDDDSDFGFFGLALRLGVNY